MKAIDIVLSSVKTKILENVASGDTSAASERLWLPSGKLPINGISKRPYWNILNALNLMLQAQDKGYSSPRWVTFNQAKAKGISVRKGEKGTKVFGWFERTNKDEEDEDSKGKPSLYARSFNVFNEEQLTEMLPASHMNTNEYLKESASLDRIDQMMKDMGVTRKESFDDSNYYVPSTDSVHLTPLENFISEPAAINVLLHELSHATGHSSRLDRGLDNGIKKTEAEYAIEEVISECSAWLSCIYLDLPFLESHSSAYIIGWLRKNPKELDEALLKASKASKLLIDTYNSIETVQETTGFLKQA